MASWPRTRWDRLSQVSGLISICIIPEAHHSLALAAVHGRLLYQHYLGRSGAYLPVISFAPTARLEELQRGARASTSASETLQPLSLLPSGGFALRMSSTAPISGLAVLDMVEKGEGATKARALVLTKSLTMESI
jgi:hypothetical protein